MTSRRGFFGKLLGGVVAAWAGPRLARQTSASLWRSVDGAMPVLAHMNPVENYPGYGYSGIIWQDRKWFDKNYPPPTPENE